jgi:hypothetical protein
MKDKISPLAGVAGLTVFCLVCGQEFRRVDDPNTTIETWPCYRWLTPDGVEPLQCPGCGVFSSAINTAPAPAPATVAALVQSLHDLCSGVREYRATATLRAAGYDDAGRQALRAAGWDPDQRGRQASQGAGPLVGATCTAGAEAREG